VEELHAPIKLSFTNQWITTLRFRSPSPLRHLLITGTWALDVLLNWNNPILFDTIAFPHLESIAIFQFRGFIITTPWRFPDESNISNMQLPTTLKTLHLQNGEIGSKFLYNFLKLFRNSLDRLTLLDLNVRENDEDLYLATKLAFHTVKTLTLDTSFLTVFSYIDVPISFGAPRGLEFLEVRLLHRWNLHHRGTFTVQQNYSLDFVPEQPLTPFYWLPSNLAKTVANRWEWIQQIPASLKILRLVALVPSGGYPGKELQTPAIMREAEANVKFTVCRERPDLEHIEVIMKIRVVL